MAVIGYDLDRVGPKDSENAPNSFLTKTNGKGFWQFGTDMYIQEAMENFVFPDQMKTKLMKMKVNEMKRKENEKKMTLFVP